jgi:predicted dehydrogenase
MTGAFLGPSLPTLRSKALAFPKPGREPEQIAPCASSPNPQSTTSGKTDKPNAAQQWFLALQVHERREKGEGAITLKGLRMAILAATGTARKRVIPAVRAQDLCTIVAVHGRDRSKLAALAKENSIPHYFVDAERMLDQTKPDFVFVGSPPVLHQEHIRMCVDRRIPILCEKPLCLSTSEARAIQALLASSIVPFRLAHHLRHQPGVTALRNFISGNAFGELLRVAMQWSFWLKETAANAKWKLEPSPGGPNVFYDAGVHLVDLMLHLLPLPNMVTAIGKQSRFRTTVDNVSALALCGDVTVDLSASQSIKCPLNDLPLDFEQATIHIPHALSEKSFTRMEIISPAGTIVQEFDAINPYAKEVEDFIGLLVGQLNLGTTIEEACRSVYLLEAITESYTTGRMVSLP